MWNYVLSNFLVNCIIRNFELQIQNHEMFLFLKDFLGSLVYNIKWDGVNEL